MAKALLEIFDEGLQRWVIATGPDGLPIVGDPETGEGWECCCGGGGGDPSPCCFAGYWIADCADPPEGVCCRYGRELFFNHRWIHNQRIDRPFNQYELITYERIQRFRYYFIESNGQCVDARARCIRDTERYRYERDGSVLYDTETERCEGEPDFQIPSFFDLGVPYHLFEYAVFPDPPTPCVGSRTDVFGDNIRSDSWTVGNAFCQSGSGIYDGMIEERYGDGSLAQRFTIHSEENMSIETIQPCEVDPCTGALRDGERRRLVLRPERLPEGAVPLKGRREYPQRQFAVSRPIEPGIADFLRRQSGCAGCGG